MTDPYRALTLVPPKLPAEDSFFAPVVDRPDRCPSCKTDKTSAWPDQTGVKPGTFCNGGWLARWWRKCQAKNHRHLHCRCTKCGWHWEVWPDDSRYRTE